MKNHVLFTVVNAVRKGKKLSFLFLTLVCSFTCFAQITYTPIDPSEIKDPAYITEIRIDPDSKTITFYDNYNVGTEFTRRYEVYVYEWRKDYSFVKDEHSGKYFYLYGNASGSAKRVTNDVMIVTSKGGLTTVRAEAYGLFNNLKTDTKYHFVIHPFAVIPNVSTTSYYQKSEEDQGFGAFYKCCTDYSWQYGSPDIVIAGKAVYENDEGDNIYGNPITYAYNKAEGTLTLTGSYTEDVESTLRIQPGAADLKIIVNGNVNLYAFSTPYATPSTKYTFIGKEGNEHLNIDGFNIGSASAAVVALNAKLGNPDEITLGSCIFGSMNIVRCCIMSEERTLTNGKLTDMNGVAKSDCIHLASTGSPKFSVGFYATVETIGGSLAGGLYEYGEILANVPNEPNTEGTFKGWAVLGDPETLYASSDLLNKYVVTDDVNFIARYGETATPVFSVGPYKTVNFAPGNLQYVKSSSTWQFASTQLEVIGNDNVSNNALADKIDLFGWGTGNNPTNTATNTGNYATFNDWGNNKIANGGDDTWFTPSYTEWNFLLNGRPNSAKLKSSVSINGLRGLLVLPDDWTPVEGVSIVPGVVQNYNCASYTLEDWEKLEANGAVFLPMGAWRNGTEIEFVTGKYINGGGYWSATSVDADQAWVLHLWLAPRGDLYQDNRNYGFSVRLAKKVTAQPVITTPTYTLTLKADLGGAILGAPSGKYEENSCFWIWAMAAEGYAFKEWNDGETEYARCVTMDRDIELTAHFVQVETALENLTPQASPACKSMVDGQLRITRDGHTYNALGTLIE